MRESKYQAELTKRIEQRFPGCLVLKNDSALRQGIPDLTVLWEGYWMMLEVKVSEDAPHQPNQDFYIDKAREMSFAAFIFPSNETEVFNGFEHHVRDLAAGHLLR